MAQNRAARELADLTRATQAQQDEAAQQAALAAERGTRGAQVARRGEEDGEADFALPEALATSVVGTLLFGPAGGLLLGAAQGWLGKRERQNVLDAVAERNAAISDSQDILRGQFDTLRSGPGVSEEDMELLGTLETQQEAAFKLMGSADPSLAQQGSALLSGVQSELQAFSTRQEEQRIETEVREDELRRVLDEQGYSRYKDIQGDFDAQSGNYFATVEKGNEILALLEDGSPFALNAALTDMAKLMDPTSAAMEGEVNAWRNLGNLLDRAQKFAGMLSDGRPLNEDQARELQQTVATIVEGRTQLQVSREAMFQERLRDAEVPEKYWDNFSLTRDVPVKQPQTIQWETWTGEARDQGRTLAESVEVGINATEEAFSTAFEKGKDALDWLGRNRIDPYLPMNMQIERFRQIQEQNEQRRRERDEQ